VVPVAGVKLRYLSGSKGPADVAVPKLTGRLEPVAGRVALFAGELRYLRGSKGSAAVAVPKLTVPGV